MSKSSESEEMSGTDEDVGSSGTSGSESEDLADTPLVATAPTVLEPYLSIIKEASKQAPKVPIGFRICGDNIDKAVHPRYMRCDRRNQSLHYFHSYAVQNRVDVSNLSDSPVDMSAYTPERMANTIVPSGSDDRALKENIAILISRVLAPHVIMM